MKRRWKPHEILLARAWLKSGQTLEQIAEAMDRSVCSIKEKVHRQDRSKNAIRHVVTHPKLEEPAKPKHEDVLTIHLKKSGVTIVNPYVVREWHSGEIR